jgi:hypothetical protein
VQSFGDAPFMNFGLDFIKLASRLATRLKSRRLNSGFLNTSDSTKKFGHDFSALLFQTHNVGLWRCFDSNTLRTSTR